VFAGDKIQHNERAIDYCRTVMAIVSGMVRVMLLRHYRARED
jgi:hypothetical protein